VVQEAVVPHREYIDRKTKNIIFTPMYCSFKISRLNSTQFAAEMPPNLVNLHTKFEANRASQSQDTSNQNVKIISLIFSSLSFCILCIIGYNLQMHTPIELKLDTLKELIKAHLCTNFD